MDLIQILLVSSTMITHIIYQSAEEYSEAALLPSIHSLSSLILWLNFLYFLRLFDSTSYLIRIIVNVFWNMKQFLFLLLLCQIGFAEAFLRLSEYGNEDSHFLDNILDAYIYTYRMSLVDNDTDSFNISEGKTTLWILFVVGGFIMQIVMLNLLISIISHSFD